MTSQSSNSLRPVLCSHSLLFILRTNSSSLFSCTSLSRDQASLRLLAQKLVQVWNDEVRDQVKWTGPAQCVDGIAFEVAAQTGATSIRHVDKKQLLPRPHSGGGAFTATPPTPLPLPPPPLCCTFMYLSARQQVFQYCPNPISLGLFAF